MVFRNNIGRSSMGRRRGGFRWQIMLLFALGAGAYYFANQKTVPITGRKQLRTMKPAQEMQLGLQSYQQILNDNRQNLVRSGEAYELIQEIGNDIKNAAEPWDPGFQWEYNLIRSEQANAFALPGGFTAVYSGLLPIAANEDGLAVIMGHEVSYVVAVPRKKANATQKVDVT